MRPRISASGPVRKTLPCDAKLPGLDIRSWCVVFSTMSPSPGARKKACTQTSSKPMPIPLSVNASGSRCVCQSITISPISRKPRMAKPATSTYSPVVGPLKRDTFASSRLKRSFAQIANHTPTANSTAG